MSAAARGPSDLGRVVAALPTLLRVGFAKVAVHPSRLFVAILAENMSLVMLVFWLAVVREGALGRFGARQFTAYFLAAAVVRMLTACWLASDINLEIRQGTLARRLIRPLHPFLGYAVDTVAALPVRLVVALPIAVLIAVVGRGDVVDARVVWVVAPLALLGAWLLGLSVNLAIGALCLHWERSLALWELWLGLVVVFSGYLLPLELFPGWLQAAVRGTPFPYLLAFPVEAMLGLVTPAQALRALAVQWGYGLSFLLAALVLWARGLPRFVAYGG